MKCYIFMKMKKNKYTSNALQLVEKTFFFHDFSLSLLTISVIASFFFLTVSADISTILTAELFGEGSTEVVFSGDGLQGGAKLVQDNIEGTGIVEEGSIIDTIIFIIKYVLIFAGILALFAFIWAGFLYITTFINDENTESAKKAMLYAAIGLIIILFSWIIVDFLTTFDIN